MFRKLLLGTALATFAAIGSANALLIDNFDRPTIPLDGARETLTLSDVGDINTSYTCVGAPAGPPNCGIIGDRRNLRLEYLGPAGEALPSTSSVSVLGSFSHSQDVAVSSRSTITWNGNANTGLGGVDLTDGGLSNFFEVNVTLVDDDITWSLRVCETAAAGGSCFTDVFNNPFEIGAGDPAQSIFRSFNPFIAAGVNLAAVDLIQFVANVNGEISVDTAIGYVQTVPEPMTMTLLGAGLAGIGLLARRRRKAA